MPKDDKASEPLGFSSGGSNPYGSEQKSDDTLGSREHSARTQTQSDAPEQQRKDDSDGSGEGLRASSGDAFREKLKKMAEGGVTLGETQPGGEKKAPRKRMSEEERRARVKRKVSKALRRKEAEEKRRKGWGYGFVILTLFTFFGLVTVATYFVVLNTNTSLPNILVNASIFALLFFIIILFFRYFVLIIFSFLHHATTRHIDEITPEYKPLKASLLVPAFNEGIVIENSIKSLLELTYPNYEIIVINDGSKDDTLKIARKWEGWHDNVQVRVLDQPNMGKANALNHGASVATGEVVICIDGDSRLSHNTLGAGMRHFADPKIGAVAGNVKVVNRSNMVTRLQTLEYIQGLNLVRRAQAFIHAVNIIPGPIGLFRRKALIDVGGWDDDTFAEDCDLTLKMLNSGYKIDYEPDAISMTEAPEDLIPLLKQRYRWTRGILQSMRKHASGLVNTKAGWRVMLTMWQMVLEGIVWPLMNIGATMMFVIVAVLYGMSPLLVLWWVQLTVLDTIASLHAIAMERESLALVPIAIIYRIAFIQIVDVTKMVASIEELLGVRMGWGKLERKGRI
ncbi:glycosyltransferase [bacterium]|nr:glycosyltransferase [bacterium]